MSNPKIKAVIFDVGGVLVRTEDQRPRTMLADAFGMTYYQMEELVFGGEGGHAAQRGEVTADENWERVRQALNIRADELETVRDTFFAGDVLDWELVKAIRGLRPTYKTAIISNAFSDLRQALAEKFKIADDFDVIVGSAEEKVMKPHPQIYRAALDRCGVNPAEAVFIDDFPRNIRGAQDVGIHGILFRSRDQVLEELYALLNSHTNSESPA
jgi:epoxide hydrolase-like predicted phosphatase